MGASFYGLPAGSIVTPYLRLDYLQEAGPRIVHLSLNGPGGEAGQNIMVEIPDIAIPTPYGPYRLYGGHRLWHSPEAMPRSYVLDDAGCTVRKTGDGVILAGPVEEQTGMQKTLQVAVAAERAEVTVTHTMQNCGVWPVELAPWAITQLRLGGVAVFPQVVGPLEPSGLLPNRNLVLWPYTRLSDPRLCLADDLHMIQALPDARPVKIAYLNRAGWAAYVLDGVLFVKRWTPQPDAAHVDFGCNCESYCNHQFIEVETVGPLARLEPGESVTHVEKWELHRVDAVEATFEAGRQAVAQVGLI